MGVAGGRGTEGRDAAILDVAERLVQTRGFNGFSYADVASELAVTKASLHYHFPSKAELGEALIDRYATRVTERLRKARLSGRTVTLKVRLHDFSTHTRSTTLPSPTDSTKTVSRLARSLLAEVDTSGGVRLLGVGVSGLADWIQEDLFEIGGAATVDENADDADEVPEVDLSRLGRERRFSPGQDVVHQEHGPGWVWGSGRGRVTVRFETAQTPPGPVRTFLVDDPALSPRSIEPDRGPDELDDPEDELDHPGGPAEQGAETGVGPFGSMSSKGPHG